MSSVAERLQRRQQRAVPERQVRLRLVYIDFWSTVKLSFLIWICLAVVLVVAAILVWVVLYSVGIFTSLDKLFQDILGDANFTIEESFGLGAVAVFALVVGLLNAIIGTVLGAVAAVLYNLSVRITGGLLVGFRNN
ncbi:MAG: DUF3566 domain-containing protein [Actinomycetales bacterium]|nr:DUF3566 domain-containing protein [Actinomycetales bacterium]